MSRTEFVFATAIILFVAFCLGWFANWLVHRFSRVAAGDVILILEAMKMETEVRASRDGTVAAVSVKAGDVVAVGDALVTLA